MMFWVILVVKLMLYIFASWLTSMVINTNVQKINDGGDRVAFTLIIILLLSLLLYMLFL